MHRAIINQLKAEHQITKHVLSLMHLQLDLLSPNTESDSYTFLENATRHLSDFYGQYHHPAEDLMFDSLVYHVPKHRSMCTRLAEEHQWFDVQESTILGHIAEARSGNSIARQTMQSLGQTYCGTHADHIKSEEDEAFPAAIVWLKAEDWDRVGKALPPMTDPLLDPDTFQSYETVFDYLIGAGKDLRRH